MNWEALGSVSNLISAIAVIVTLVYLAIQVRQNNVLMEAAKRATMVSLNTDVWKTMIEVPELAQLALKDRNNEQLTNTEELRLNALWARALYNAEYVFEEAPAHFYKNIEVWRRGFAAYGSLRRTWKGGGSGSILACKDMFSPRFIEFIEINIEI